MINYKIESQNDELVRDQIGLILAAEFNNQAVNQYNTDCEGVKFFIQRFSPIMHTEVSIVNISRDSTDRSNKSQNNINGSVTYNIDVYTNSKKLGGERPDTLASFKAQRIVGIITAILENNIYLTLGFDPGFIQGTMVSSDFPLDLKNEHDGISSTAHRIVFDVRMNERFQDPPGNPLLSNYTQVKLSETELGFQYTYE